jgi:nitroreductase
LDHARPPTLLCVDDRRHGVDRIELAAGEAIMKIIVSVLIVLSALGLATVPASALDAKSFFEQQERQTGGA